MFDFLVSRRAPLSGLVFGGIGDTFANTNYLSRSSVFMTALPVRPVRLMVGAARYSATGGSDAISHSAYDPRQLTAQPHPSRSIASGRF